MGDICAIHTNTLSSVYTDSTIKSKQSSQLLFGELCIIKSERNNFCYIESNIDSYCGWVHKDVFAPLSPIEYERLKDRATAQICLPLAQAIDVEKGEMLHLPAGSFAHDYNAKDNSFYIAKRRYQVFPDTVTYCPYGQLGALESIALSFIGAPLMDGGKSILGIDTGGYIQLIFSLCGFRTPRGCQEQLQMGVPVYSTEQLRMGDVIFIVAHDMVEQSFVYLGDNRIINVQEKVKITELSKIENLTSSVVIRRLV